MSQHKNISENMKLKGNSVNPGNGIDVFIDARESVNLLECDSLLLTPPTMRMNIRYKDLVYKIQDKRKNSVCGSIVPGELTAIIGPSGAGKSTLLDVLSGFKTNISSGVITVNGQIRNDEEFRKCCAYIMQEDVMLPNLTVLESMMVTEILRTLGLESVSNSYVCHVSGGQRRRISIALELVSNPPVIFLDEPTSGLDSHSAYQCISLMNSLVKQGRTICFTIHQPSARLYELFEKIVVLAEGTVLYSGYIGNMIEYFATLNLVCPKYHNPADFVMEVASGYYGVKVDYLSDKWRAQELEFSITEDDCEEEHTSLLPFDELLGRNVNTTARVFFCDSKRQLFTNRDRYQFYILTARSMKGILRDKMFTYLRFSTTIAIAILLGTLYYGIGNDGAIPLEKNVFIREHLNNWYTLKSYYLSKTFSDLPFQVAVFVAPVTGIPLLLFCGYFVKFSAIPVYLRWFTYVSYVRYCWEGAILSLYGDQRGALECKKIPCMFNDGEEILRFLDITEDALGIKNFRLWFCIIILMLFFILLRLLTYIVLRIAISNRRK
ncbi:hypothetical protein MXB_1010 [Myxobolus squamalis]|nr:hypothetical protein MXB_1010 [Myxobolus squamalis]